MMKRGLLAGIVGLAAAGVALGLVFTQPASPASSTAPAAGNVTPASLVQVRSFGVDPSGLGMYIYVPHSVRPRPPILVAVHGCGDSGPGFYDHTGFSTLADEWGFIVIYPSSPSRCFDTSSAEVLRRGGGSDPVSIMSMISYAERVHHGDSRHVYITGASAGGFVTSVMLGDYPDVFRAGAIFMGVPFGCLRACATIPATMTPQEWGDVARGGDPGYHGPRPRVQVWHGTADPDVRYVNFGEEIKQWTNVLGVSQVPLATGHPQPGWTETTYGFSLGNVEVEAYSIAGVGHVLPEVGMERYVIHFFGLDQGEQQG